MITVEQERNGVEALYAVGHWLLQQGKYGDAAAVLRTLVQVAPTDERGWLALGVCHEQVEQPEVALEMYGTGCAFSPTSARCHLARARLLRASGEEEAASEAFEAASEAFEAASEAADDDDDLSEIIEQERGL